MVRSMSDELGRREYRETLPCIARIDLIGRMPLQDLLQNEFQHRADCRTARGRAGGRPAVVQASYSRK